MRRVVWIGVAAASCVVVVALSCSPFSAADGPADGSAASPPDGAAEGAADGAAEATAPDGGWSPSDPHCPQAIRGPRMVHVAGVCIDSWEVTFGEYAAFVADPAKRNFLGRTQCSAKTDVTNPTPANVPAKCGSVSGTPNTPIVCVDWCDAVAYCAWAGKRLCGALNVGGPTVVSAVHDPAASEWARVCLSGGAYPTGASLAPGCNVADAGHTTPLPHDRSPGCEGPTGVYDMVGNVAEWLDSCGGTACEVGGETYRFRTTGFAAGLCAHEDSDPPSTTHNDEGIRCCANPVP